MSLVFDVFSEKSRLRALLDRFSVIDDPREAWRVAHPLPEVLLLVVCATMADCDDFDGIALWGKKHLPFLRRYLPFHHGVPGGRWLNLLMNRIDPALFCAAFTAWVREIWPDRPDLVAIDGKTSRRSHDRAEGKGPLHLVSAFATTSRLVLGQEAVESKSNELQAIPVLLERLAQDGGLKGALVSIDAIPTNAKIAQAIKDAGADYLLAVKANQPRLRKGHGAKNMAVVRHFAINLVRAAKDKHSLKLRRKAAGWDQAYLANLLGAIPVNPDSEPWS